MIKNYLKVAWRNLVKNKPHTFINIAGLSVGLACSLLILLWVQSELNTDAFHKNAKNLYQVYERQTFDHKTIGQYLTPGLLGNELKRTTPEIKYAISANFGETRTFKVGDKLLKLIGAAADSDFFKMFSYPLIQGDEKNALNSPLSISISNKMAVDFFGSAQAAMGKTIRFEDKQDFMVTAVFADVKANSSLKFDYVYNWIYFLKANDY